MSEYKSFNLDIRIKQELLHAAHMLILGDAMLALQKWSLDFSDTVPTPETLEKMSPEERIAWAENTITLFATYLLDIGIPGGMIKQTVSDALQERRRTNGGRFIREKEEGSLKPAEEQVS